MIRNQSSLNANSYDSRTDASVALTWNELTRASIEPSSLIFSDPLMQKVVERARIIAVSDSPVLIFGETGTGKEMIARYVHQQSSRSQNAFVALNCAAIPDGLLESELFGHERGAFSGAIRRQYGKMEIASGGTLLLDEVSELDTRLQAKLLRALQEREIDRIGGTKPIKVNTRIIATTNKQLSVEVRRNRLRIDFYHRINTMTIDIPSLRERRGDILPLTSHFLAKYSGKKSCVGSLLDESAREELVAYQWPGNVRELENTIQRALVFAKGGSITRDLLGLRLVYPDSVSLEDAYCLRATQIDLANLKDLEARVIIQTLGRLAGNRTQAAKSLGISTRTLRRKLRDSM